MVKMKTRKTNLKRGLLSVVAASVCGAIAFSAGACSLLLDTQKVDETKTQLYVSNFNGGVGDEWLNKAISRFETAYAEVSFTEGKKGVEVIVNNNKENLSTLGSTLEGGTVDEVFFAERMYMYEWAQEGYMLDISDVVRGSLSKYGEQGSIEDKLDDDQKSMLTSIDGNYYAIPHYDLYNGITYNVNLFDAYGFYFDKDGKIVGEQTGFTSMDSYTGTLSAGPDGIEGNDDDGLPRSLEQYKQLCEFMTVQSVTPFIWAGLNNGSYFTKLLSAVSLALLGKEGAELIYSFNEDNAEKYLSTVVMLDSNGKIVYDENGDVQLGTTEIDETTGYLVWRQSAYYYAIDFAWEVLHSGEDVSDYDIQWYTTNSRNNSYDQLSAQRDFLASGAAMLIDGNWWVNEAADYIGKWESDYGKDFDTDTNFAWMPLPSYATTAEADAALEAGITDSTTLKSNEMQSYAFIYSGISEEKAELAKTFLQFCYTDESLEEFTLTTGIAKGVSYDLSATQLSSLNSFAQSMWNSRKSAETVNTSSSYTLYLANEENFTDYFWSVGTAYKIPYLAFNSGGLSIQAFFEGMTGTHTRTSWQSSNSAYYVNHTAQSEEVITAN